MRAQGDDAALTCARAKLWMRQRANRLGSHLGVGDVHLCAEGHLPIGGVARDDCPRDGCRNARRGWPKLFCRQRRESSRRARRR